MTNRNFDEWLSKFRPSISSYDYYIDFEKVIKNVDEIKVELNILNSLIGSKNIEDEFEKVVTRYPETLNVYHCYLQSGVTKYTHRMKMEHFYTISKL